MKQRMNFGAEPFKRWNNLFFGTSCVSGHALVCLVLAPKSPQLVAQMSRIRGSSSSAAVGFLFLSAPLLSFSLLFFAFLFFRFHSTNLCLLLLAIFFLFGLGNRLFERSKQQAAEWTVADRSTPFALADLKGYSEGKRCQGSWRWFFLFFLFETSGTVFASFFLLSQFCFVRPS